MSHLHTFPLLQPVEIANSPTIRDEDQSWSASKEEGVRKKAARVIYETSKNYTYPMSSGTAAMAVTLFVRFYSRLSMARNHPFVIALASLFLAGKANDEPRSLRSLMVEMLKQWYGRSNPELRERLADTKVLEELWQTTVDAEEYMLITLEFDLNVDLIHATVARVVKKTTALAPLRHPDRERKVQQFYINACNDIMRRDSTMVLQYSATEIALAICCFYFKFSKGIEAPPVAEDGRHWYELEGLSQDVCDDICNRFVTKIYVTSGLSTQKTPSESQWTVEAGESSKGTATALTHAADRQDDGTSEPASKRYKIADAGSEKIETIGEETTDLAGHSSVPAPTPIAGPGPITAPPPVQEDEESDLEEGEIRG